MRIRIIIVGRAIRNIIDGIVAAVIVGDGVIGIMSVVIGWVATVVITGAVTTIIVGAARVISVIVIVMAIRVVARVILN